MTDEAKALVELLREVKDWWRQPGILAEQTADLIETQAREIERLNAILSDMNDTDIIARTMAENERLREALREGRRAIGDHIAPNDCYTTGPLTGDDYRDLVECPACSFIAMYDKALGGQHD